MRYQGIDIEDLSPEQRQILEDERTRLRAWLGYPETMIMLARVQDLADTLLSAYDNCDILHPEEKTRIPLSSAKVIEMSAYEIQVTRRFIKATLPTILESVANFDIDPEPEEEKPQIEPWSWSNWIKKSREYCSQRLALILKLGRRKAGKA